MVETVGLCKNHNPAAAHVFGFQTLKPPHHQKIR